MRRSVCRWARWAGRSWRLNPGGPGTQTREDELGRGKEHAVSRERVLLAGFMLDIDELLAVYDMETGYERGIGTV